MHQYEIGQKIQYLDDQGKWKLGKIHGQQTHSNAIGIVVGISYVVDTGKNIRVDEVPQLHPKTREIVRIDKVRQPEQVVVNEDMLRAV